VRLLADEARPLTRNELLGRVNIRQSRLDAMLKILEVEGAIERTEGGYRRTLTPWTYPVERVRAVTELRRAEQQAMQDYLTTTECLMVFLRRQLDDAGAEPCGRCANCTGLQPSDEVDRDLVTAARESLRTADLRLEPRQRWPSGLGAPSGAIPVDRRAEPGRALSIYGDAGWGRAVRDGKFVEGRFSDELVNAAADLIRARWSPEPAPTWVTCVPSESHPDLVPDFARRLADALGLRFEQVVRRVRPRRPQKEMENSGQQARNVLGAFAVEGEVPAGPVLLVDDIADSLWTITIVVQALRDAGSGPVHPLVLARAQGR